MAAAALIGAGQKTRTAGRSEHPRNCGGAGIAVLKSGASYPLSRAKRDPLRGEGDETPGALRSGLRRNGPSLGVGRAEWETARTLGESTPYPAGGPSPPGPGLIPEGSRCCQ